MQEEEKKSDLNSDHESHDVYHRIVFMMKFANKVYLKKKSNTFDVSHVLRLSMRVFSHSQNHTGR